MCKRCIYLILPAVMLTLMAGTATEGAYNPLSDPALVGWWACDEGQGITVKDSSPNKRDGTAYAGLGGAAGVGTLIWVPGVYGSAIELKYPNLVQIPAVNMTMTQATMAGWIKRIGSQVDWSSFIMTRGTATGFNIFSNSLAYHWNDTSSTYNYRPPAPIPNNEWTHCAVTIEPTRAVFYLNGSQVAVNTVAHTAANWNAPIFLGGDGSGSQDPRRMTDGILDDVSLFSRALTGDEVKAIMQGLSTPGAAADPAPADTAVDVPRDTSLAWTPGPWAVTHDVYLGGAFADVNSASRTNQKDVLAGQGQTPTTYQPAALLEYGKTYYWRVDEVNKPSDNTIFKGGVWSFTVEPYAYPVKPVAATASSFQTGMTPDKTIDGSGMTADQHGTEPTTMWLSAGVQPNWIQYEFDAVYKLHELWVWNSNQLIESFLGFGAKSVKIETSTDGATWVAVADVPEFSKAPGAAGYAANTKVSLGGASAKFVKLTITTTWGGVAPQAGLAEVRFFYAPMQAFGPRPANAATGVAVEAALDWRPGREATSHTVFFGTDQAAVAAGTAPAKTVTAHGFSPDPMALGTTYYWKVDEVGATGTYPGTVWSFTTKEFAVVDDFESYTEKDGNRIYQLWPDGFDNPATNGAVVGLDAAVNGTFGETTIIHGGKQSMPLAYDNSKAPLSEAVLTLAPAQNWTANGIKSLSLWFRGVAGNSGQLYVKVNSTKLLYDGDTADLARAGWQVWNIDLSKAGNVNSVRSLTIGIEGAGAKGLLYIDDIRLYPKEPQYITPVAPAATNLAAHYTCDESSGTRVGDSSGNNRHGTTTGNPQWVAGKIGGALKFNGTTEYVETNYTENLAKWTVCAWVTSPAAPAATSPTGPVHREKNYQIDWNHTNDVFRGAAAMAIGGTWYAAKFDTLNSDTWYHLTATFDGTALRAYTNGVLTTTTPAAGVPDAEVGTLKLGRHSTAANFFGGTVDDVRIYSRPLSDAEIAGLAGQTKARHQPF